MIMKVLSATLEGMAHSSSAPVPDGQNKPPGSRKASVFMRSRSTSYSCSTEQLETGERSIEAHEARLGGHLVWELASGIRQGNVRMPLICINGRAQHEQANRLDAFFIETLGISKDDQEALWLVDGTSSSPQKPYDPVRLVT